MRTTKRARLALALTATSLVAAAPAAADPGQPVQTWVPDGPVNAVEVSGDTAYLGGQFTRLGPYTGGAVSLDPAGARRTTWPDVSGTVETTLADGSGGWYIGGSFSSVGGEKRSNLAHILPNGTVDAAWAPAADKPVYALASSGKSIVAGGSFTTVAGEPHGALVELDTTTGRPTAWAGRVDGTVHALYVTAGQGGTVYAGGTFTKAGSTPRANLAAIKLDAQATVANFNPSPNGEVFDLDLGPKGIYAGGAFDRVNATTDRIGLASFDPATGVVTNWNPGLRERAMIHDVDVTDTTVYAAGRIEGVNKGRPTAVARENAAAFDATDATVTAWDPRATGEVYALEPAGDRIYLGGRFGRIGPSSDRLRLAAVTKDTGAPLPFDPSANAAVKTIGVNGNDVFVGGDLTSIGGVQRNNLAAIDLKTGRPTDFDPNVDSAVYALDLAPNGLWAGGDFSKANGTVDRSRLAQFNPTTGRVGEFSQSFDQTVRAVAVDGTTVYAGGLFQKVNGGIVRNRVAAFREVPGTGGLLLPFDPNVNGPVYAVLPLRGRVYLGGMFTTTGNGSAVRPNAAAHDATNGAPTPWNPAVNQPVHALTENRGSIVAGGPFDKVNGTVTRRAVAAFNPDDGLVTAFDGQVTGSISALASDGDRFYAGGTFGANGSPADQGLGQFDTAVPGLGTWRPDVRLLPGGGTTTAVSATAAEPGRWVVAGGQLKIDSGAVRTVRFAAFPLPPLPARPTEPTQPTQPTQPTGQGGNNAGDRTAPKITVLKASRKRFRAGRLPRRGTSLSVTLSEQASVTYDTFVTKTRRTAKGKKRKVLVRVARFTKQAPTGTSRVDYTAQNGRKALKPGTYMVRATPTDAAGNAGKPRSIKLKVVK